MKKLMLAVAAVAACAVALATTHEVATVGELMETLNTKVVSGDEVVLTAAEYDFSAETPTTASSTYGGGTSLAYIHVFDKSVTIRSASGDPKKCVLKGRGNFGDVADSGNTDYVDAKCMHLGRGSQTVKGITFRNFYSSTDGGALLIGHAQNTQTWDGTVNRVEDCVFENCASSSKGGGASLCGTFKPSSKDAYVYTHVRGCDFTNCWSKGTGAGLATADTAGYYTDVVDGNFTDLTAYTSNGGIVAGVCTNCVFTRCKNIPDNTANRNSGVGSASRWVNCKFFDNHAAWKQGVGGGTFINCEFSGNTAYSALCIAQSATFYNCIITNHTENENLATGPYYNCIIANNTSKKYLCGTGPLVNCLVMSNRFNGAVSGGWLTNTVFFGNIGLNNRANCDFGQGKPHLYRCIWGGVTYSDSYPNYPVECWTNTVPEVWDNMEFAGPEKHPKNPWAPRRASFMVGRGALDPALTNGEASVDIEGRPRVVGTSVDLGPSEYQPSIGLMMLLR